MAAERLTIFILLQATEAWLKLTRQQRRDMADAHVGAALERYPALSMRYFDAEAFSGFCSDVMMIAASELQQYYDFIETLRDSPMFAEPWFRIVQIVPAIEEGFRGYEARQA
jgi:hypothetical protein